MPKIVLHHDRHLELVDDPDGDLEVLTPDGPATRRADQVEAPGGVTTLELPDGYDPTPQALTDLVAAVRVRHCDEVEAVSGDDARLVAKLAALFDADVLEDNE